MGCEERKTVSDEREDMMPISRVIILADRLMVFSFCALIYFLPISIALVESFVGLAFFSYLIKCGFIFYSYLKETKQKSFLKIGSLFWQAFKPVESILNRPIGVFIFVGFLTIFISQYPVLSIKGFLFKLLEWAFIYFNFVGNNHSKQTTKTLSVYA